MDDFEWDEGEETARVQQGCPYPRRLRNRLPAWRHLTGVDPWVLDVIENGYRLEWADGVEPDTVYYRIHRGNHESCYRQYPNAEPGGPPLDARATVTAEIANLLKNGVIAKTSKAPRVVLPLGTVRRPGSNKLRLILDARWLNKRLLKITFRYEMLKDVPSIFAPGSFMCSLDISSAYHHVPLHPSAYTYVGFEWDGQYYVFLALPFGLTSACRVFTKVMRTVVKHWRGQGIDLLPYIDDFGNGNPVAALARAHNRQMQADLRRLGFVVAAEKGQSEPSQRIVFLGGELDFTTPAGHFGITPERWSRCQALLAQAPTTLGAQFPLLLGQRIAGHIMSFHPATDIYGYMFTRGLHRLIAAAEEREERWLVLDADTQLEFNYWRSAPRNRFRAPIFRPPLRPQCFIHSDASDGSWGAHLSATVHGAQIRKIHGSLSPEERIASSTAREAVAALRAIQHFLPHLHGLDVALRTDNQNLSHNIDRGGSMNPLTHRVVHDLLHLCIANGIRVRVDWIPREENVIADAESKALSYAYIPNDWSLLDSVFERILSDLGPISCDLFASALTARHGIFYTRDPTDGAAGTDAFSLQNWAKLATYTDEGSLAVPFINPPFSQLPSVLKKLRTDQATAILIFPLWRSALWWPRLLAPGSQGSLWANWIRRLLIFPRHQPVFQNLATAGDRPAPVPPHWGMAAAVVSFAAAPPPRPVPFPSVRASFATR